LIDFFVSSTFSEFASKWSRDQRFRAIEKMRERELLYNEYMVEVRRQEESESRGQIERVCNSFIYSLCTLHVPLSYWLGLNLF